MVGLLKFGSRFSTYFRWLIGRCSLVYGASIVQDKDLGMYSPAESRTSRHLSCSHELCALGSSCNSPKQPCPYNINYYSENTSSSGLLVEDTLYLASNEDHRPIQASVIIGWAVVIYISNVYGRGCFLFIFISLSFHIIPPLKLFLIFNAVVVGGKVVIIWMELLLMVFLDWDLGKFRFQASLQDLDWCKILSQCAFKKKILGEFTLGIRGLPPNSLLHLFLPMGNSKFFWRLAYDS